MRARSAMIKRHVSRVSHALPYRQHHNHNMRIKTTAGREFVPRQWLVKLVPKWIAVNDWVTSSEGRSLMRMEAAVGDRSPILTRPLRPAPGRCLFTLEPAVGIGSGGRSGSGVGTIANARSGEVDGGDAAALWCLNRAVESRMYGARFPTECLHSGMLLDPRHIRLKRTYA
jgi:hypothetical protein